MRTMMRVTIPVETGNAAIKSGRLAQVMGDTIARLKPEAVYFAADKGLRTAYFFINVSDQSEMPSLAEPFFQEFNASVEIMPVMNPDDLKKGLSQIAGK